jgi:two-component system, LytTR family, sensor kinase
MKKEVQERLWLRLIIILAGWSLIAIFFASRNIVISLNLALPFEQWRFGVITEIVYWYIWVPLTPLIFWFAGLFPINRKNWSTKGVLVLLFGLFITFFQLSLEIVINLVIIPRLLCIPREVVERIGSIQRIVLFESFTGFLTYVVLIGSYYAFDYYQKYQARDTRAKQLEGMLARSELQNLKMQLQPHFLFNTLHTISVLMNNDTGLANRTLIRLGDLLRMTLENVNTQEVQLKDELEFLEGYLEIEQTRFRDRLKVNIRIEPDVFDVYVPSFILQPLVENAVRHGFLPLLSRGVIEVIGGLDNGMVRLEVRDNGLGLKLNNEGRVDEGIGLSTIRARLVQLYGEEQHFEVRNVPGGGVLATVVLPLRKMRSENCEDGK